MYENKQQKRTSNSPSPSLSGLSKDHSVRNSLDNSSRLYDTGMQEITDIPDDYLNQSHVLKHLAKEVKAPTNLRDSGVSENDNERLSLTRNDKISYENKLPPPDYPKWLKTPLRISKKNEKFALSRSQPDLSSCDGANSPRPRTKGREDVESSELWPSAEMVEILIKENSALKAEVENCYQRISKTQKVSLCRQCYTIFYKICKYTHPSIYVFN